VSAPRVTSRLSHLRVSARAGPVLKPLRPESILLRERTESGP
jgi:hypothetical protein